MSAGFTQRDAAAAVTILPLVGWLIGSSFFSGELALDTAGLYGLIAGSCAAGVLLLAAALFNRKFDKERAEGE